MFDALVIAYLFLGGTGAALGGLLGLLTLGQVLGLGESGRGQHLNGLSSGQHRRFFGFGNVLAAAVCLLGAVCLLFDMERPDKVLVLLTSPNTSLVAMGAYSLGAVLLLSALAGVLHLHRRTLPPAAGALLCAAQLVAACVTMTYTALLLMGFRTVAFFQTWALVGLFFCSSASCGLALATLTGMVLRVFPLERGHERTAAAEAALSLLEGLFLVLFMIHAHYAAPQAFAQLATGPLAWAFWTVVVGCGVASPVAAWALPRFVRGYRLHGGLSPALVLLAGFALRFCVIAVV